MTYCDTLSKSYDELHGSEQLNKIKIINSSIIIGKNTKMLDVGCGTGISSQINCDVVGIDPSIGMLKLNKNTKKIVGLAESLPFKNKPFDYVVSVTAVHNFKNIRKSLAEIKRVGRENFIFSVLRKAKKFSYIGKLIEKSFKINKIVEEEKDIIFFCQNKL